MTIRELHTKAMDIASIGYIFKNNGDIPSAKEKFIEAFSFEKQAALTAYSENIGEPSVSIFLKGAAYLAMNADLLDQAEKLICLALSGDTPIDIAEELRNLLEDLYFQRHLKLQGIEIFPSEFQMAIAGRGIGYGMAKSDEVLDRVAIFEKIAYRTAERKSGKPFRKSGDVPKIIKLGFQPYISVGRAASFAFTMRFGVNHSYDLFGSNQTADIIDDIFTNIILVNDGNYDQLKENIKDDTYLNNFVSLSKELAPDGNDVNMVGFTVIRNNKPIEVKFTKNRKEIHLLPIAEPPENNVTFDISQGTIKLTGRLSAADEDKSNLRLNLPEGEKRPIKVPDGLDDIVKKYFGSNVTITGIPLNDKKNTVKLIEIDPA